ncbi:MAG: hypothetical protein KatS3mg091_433 [Patescibacteria group bacterium]|nr:MAG: hypothetical protein KatS3mg091_433 [Patescibacteria group bacterium]
MQLQKLFFGLGNFSDEYKHTRHNAGHLFIDYIADQIGQQLKTQPELKTAYFKLDGLIFAKNVSFMNLSGRSLYLFCQYYKFNEPQITVIYDDLDIPLGKFKYQTSTYSKTHNGLKSIGEYYNLDKLSFIRIGIDNRTEPISGQRYVLSKFKKEEMTVLNQVFSRIAKLILGLILYLQLNSLVFAQSINIIPTEVIANFNLGFVPYLFISFVYLTLMRFGLRLKKDVEIYGTTILFVVCTAIGWFFNNYAISLVIIIIYTLMYIGD